MKNINPCQETTTYTIKAGNGEMVNVTYPSNLVYRFETEIKQLFEELHVPQELTLKFLSHYRKTGNMDYRRFLEIEAHASLDKDFWMTYRLDYGMGNEPCQLGGGNCFILSVDEDSDVVTVMLKRKEEKPETFQRYSPVGGGYRNWRYTDYFGHLWCACESSYLAAMRECKEESGKHLDTSSMVFFNRENATSCPNGQWILHAESQFYLAWTNYNNLRDYLGSSYEGATRIIKVKELDKYPVFTACKQSVKKLVKQYGN